MLLLIYHVDWAHKTSWILAINRSEDVSNCPENYTLARMMRRIITCCQQIRLLHPPKQCPRPLKAFWINYDSCADDVNLGETSPGTVCNEVPTFWASFLWPPEITGNHLKKKKKSFPSPNVRVSECHQPWSLWWKALHNSSRNAATWTQDPNVTSKHRFLGKVELGRPRRAEMT